MAVYLDYASTTPLDARVLEAMLPYLQTNFANPSSLHAYGQKARAAIETAREQLAGAINAEPREIIFTSGATEADNHALRLLMQGAGEKQLISSTVEHAAVLQTGQYLEQQGTAVHWLEPNPQGELSHDALAQALNNPTQLVALMLVNNETGVINDIHSMAALAHEAGASFFCDAVQAFGVMPVDVHALGVDVLALSAHKFYGPKGVGALWLQEGVALKPFLQGGEQERGLRAGTHNVAAIVGMGEAAALAQADMAAHSAKLSQQRDWLTARLLEHEGVYLNTGTATRSPKHINIRVDAVDGEAMLFMLDQAGVAVSAGSACSAGSIEPSHVLTAMGLSRQQAKASLRFSLGKGLTEVMLEQAAQAFADVLSRCRQFS